MDIIQNLLLNFQSLIPTSIALLGVVVILFIIHQILNRRYTYSSGHRIRLQIIMTVLSFAGLLVIILVLPIKDSTRGQILSLIGILFSAAIALSATTVLGNAMAGFMLRVMRNFKPGDFIRAGEHFGRMTERGLFHIEIQTEDSDLTTLPNLFLVANPVKVIRSSGTFITAAVSLGYDVPRTVVDKLLKQAAAAAELKESFVHILKLGDSSVTYKVSGFLDEVKQVITSRSRLHELILDKLHEEGIEIVSPSFMNTRAIINNKQFIPKTYSILSEKEKPDSEEIPESLVFDKADKAASVEQLRENYQVAGRELEEIKEKIEQAKDENEQNEYKKHIYRLEARRELLSEFLKSKEKKKKK